MVLGTAEGLFTMLESINLDHLTKRSAGVGTTFFKGVLLGGRGICGVYVQNNGCYVYIQRKELDPTYPDEIPIIFNLQIELCSFFGTKSKADAPNFEDVRRTLGSEYYSMFWG